VAKSGTRKAAELLMGLAPETAAELLKTAPEDTVKEIAAEMASLNATGGHSDDIAESEETAREFFTMVDSVTNRDPGEFGGAYFLDNVLEMVVGREQSRTARQQVDEMVRSRDPFLGIRSADPEHIALALQGEPPEVISLVLSELRTENAGEVLPLLDDHDRAEVVRAMTVGKQASVDVRLRVAASVHHRLNELKWKEQGELTLGKQKEAMRNKRLRKIAIILQGLSSELCESLLEELAKVDPETVKTVRNLMVVWEDIPRIEERCLREILRAVESQKLALSLYEAAPRIAAKIRSNISERASAMVDEELSFLSSPKAESILESRESILNALREMNANGDLEMTNR
jgi:flagellar motor switch protein FliG